MKKIVSLMAVVSGLMVCDVQAQAVASKPASTNMVARPTKIAFFDPQGVVTKSDKWKEDVEKAEVEFKQRIADVQKQKEDFNQRAKNPATAADRDLAKDLAKAQKNIEIDERSLQMELQQKQQELEQGIAQKVDAAVEAVVKAQGWDAIIPKSFYVNPDIDLTNAIAEQMNKDWKKEKAAAKLKKDAAKAPAVAEKK